MFLQRQDEKGSADLRAHIPDKRVGDAHDVVMVSAGKVLPSEGRPCHRH